MADRRAVGILRHLGDATHGSLPDAALLAWFVAERDEPAFTELVRRHGPMVLGVCQRITRQRQDAEDAFQATFLILARKAGRVARPELLANWLYGVAYRVARKARRAAARRRAREGRVAVMPDTGVLPAESTSDLAAFLDAELAALPERFRAAIVLCDLYELSHAAAAERLGIPKGTLSNRLSAGRKKLAARLARRGITLPAVGLGVALGGVTPTLAARTVSLALGGVASAAVQQLTLTGGASMKAIGWTAAACAAIGLAAGVVSALPGDEPAKPTPAAKAAPAAKAEEPKPDKEPGAIPRRPRTIRMVRRIELQGSASRPVWNPNGKLLALTTDNTVEVFDTAKLSLRAIVQTGRSMWRLPYVIGFLQDQPILVMYRREVGRINAVNQLEFWEMPEVEPKPRVNGVGHLRTPDRVVNLDVEDGRPFALLPDGTSVMSIVERTTSDMTGKKTVAGYTFRLIDTTSGKPIRDVLKAPGTPRFKLSRDGRSLYLGIFEKGVCALERWDVDSGKRKWRREIAKLQGWEKVKGHILVPILLSPDGKMLAATVPATSLNEAGDYPYRLRLFETAAGTEGARLEDQADWFNNGYSFSADGRLLVGEARKDERTNPPPKDRRIRIPPEIARRAAARANSRLLIWDTQSGKVLKSWPGQASAAFSPAQPILAILETETSTEPDGDNRKQVTSSILGLWDVAPLLKAAPSK
jgi:RNA polymerase sigma factor (sigma-70 family)